MFSWCPAKACMNPAFPGHFHHFQWRLWIPGLLRFGWSDVERIPAWFLGRKGRLPVSQLMANGENYDQLPSGYVKIAIENGPVEIVDLAIKIWMFHSYVSLPEGSSFGNENTPIFSDKPWKSNHKRLHLEARAMLRQNPLGVVEVIPIGLLGIGITHRNPQEYL